MSMTRWLAWGLAFPATVAATGAAAQTAVNAPAVRETVDANGVDLIRGAFNTTVTDVSIGPAGSHGLAYTRSWEGNGWRDNLSSGISGSTSSPVVTVGNASDSFTLQGGSYTADQSNGATLVQLGGNGSGGDYVYTSSSGTVARFGVVAGTSYATTPRAVANIAVIKSITYPDGTVVTFNYLIASYTVYDPNGNPSRNYRFGRISSVINNIGYKLLLQYQSDNLSEDSGPYDGWAVLAKVVAINIKIAGCDPNATSCVSVGNWPSATYDAYNPNVVTDAAGRATHYSYDSLDHLTNIRRSGSSVDDVVIGYDSNNRVQTITRVGSTWTYGFAPGSGILTATTSNPNGTSRSLVSSTANAEPTSSTDELGRTTSYTYTSSTSSLLKLITYPDTNSIEYGYDGRGNVTSTKWHAKPRLGGPDIATSATYPTSCTNAKTCNQPISTFDAKSNETDYSYDGTHGGVTQITRPAAANGIHPTTQIGYTGYSDGNGGTIYLPTSSTMCRTQSSCSGTSDQIVATTSYGSVANNLLPQSATRRAGDSSVSATTSMTYDAIGNVTGMTDPVNATTQLRYNADRQVTETISADPDGSGPLKPRAVRTSYNTDGTVSMVESGTDTGSNFVSLQQANASYDSYGRKTRDTLTAGGTTYGVTDYSFDVNGRPSCTAVRMNPSTWSNQPGACSQTGNGADGPDRITQIGYDAVGRPKTQTSGVGTSTPRSASWAARPQTSGVGTSTPIQEVKLYYSINGTLIGADDAKGNDTALSLDAYDRVYATSYPDNSYELLTLDANGNATSKRLRDGNSLGFGYDNLNRLVSLTTAHLTPDDQNVSYTYDLLGHLTLAAKNASNQTALTWDALGRKTGESNYYYALTFGYDAAGRRTRETWNDGFYVTYDYDMLGEMTAVHENGGFVLASFGYDDLGRRTSLTRGNGTTTSYGYDGASRLASLSHDLSGSSWDLSLTFGYNAASQIKSRTSSNSAYAWGGAVNVDRAYSTNNLNQYTSAGSTSFGYDQRGNLTTSGSTSYGYTSQNRLATAGGGYLYADSLDRHDSVSSEGEVFTHDGGMIASEIAYGNGTATVHRRYVWGPGADEPLVWYEGSGTSDRRWLHADERGSIVAVSDGSGTKLAVNTYDEFGIPGASNIGRFQYTGQAYYPSIGLYDYKARMYSPTLGRFLQTDPIGYGDGMNLYNYVHADPVNFTDPSGTYCSKPDAGISNKGGAANTNTDSLSPEACAAIGYTYIPDVNVTGTRPSPSSAPQSPTIGAAPPTVIPSGGTQTSTPPQRGTLLRRLYRWVNPDVCQGKGSNEGYGHPAGIKPYNVNEGASLSTLLGHVLPDHQFSGNFSDSRYLTGVILTTILTNPVRASGGSVRYTVNTGQNVGYDSKNEAYSDYITVIMGPPGADGSRALRTAYPGCP